MRERDGVPDPLVIASVVDIARVLDETETVRTWSGANMFVPDTSERATLSEFEIAMLGELDVLTDVCVRPHDRLDRTTEVVRADLARRVPPAGLSRLAAHPEEWAGVDHGRIHPLRVLSQRYTEDVDFYENRVAAQLVDRLGEHLTRRIRELTTLADGLVDLDKYDQTLRRRQSWRRLDRVARLVAQAVSDMTASAVAIEQSRNRLLQARARLRGLQASPVLRCADRRARVPMKLMRTNLFTNDRRYRRVGALWELWAVHEATATEQRRAADSGFPTAYTSYVAALALRAMAVIGYVPLDSTAPVPRPGATVRLGGPAGELAWSVDPDGTARVFAGDSVLAQVVPVTHDLGAEVSEPIRLEWFDQLDTFSKSVIVVYPGLRVGRAALPTQWRRRAHPSGFGSGPCVVPVSPLEIEGEERIARALRWIVQGQRFAAEYPPEADLPRRTQGTAGDWFQPVGYRRLAVTRRPSAEERAELERALIDEGRDSRRDRAREDVQGYLVALDGAVELFKLFETCPICHSTQAELQARDRGTFQCRCTDCESAWGTRVCGSCSKRYPILWPRNAIVDPSDGDRLDMTAGADVLALPCAGEPATSMSRFRCPWCGYCAGQPACGCPEV